MMILNQYLLVCYYMELLRISFIHYDFYFFLFTLGSDMGSLEMQPPSMPAPVPEEISEKEPEVVEIAQEQGKGNVDPHQLQVQQHMLMQYTTQAYKNGAPSSLPIFCSQCLRPFTYPIGAISIKCPMCLTVNSITQTPASSPPTVST